MRRVADPSGTPIPGFRRVAAFKSESWPASFRNGGRHQIGMPGRNASEFAAILTVQARMVVNHRRPVDGGRPFELRIGFQSSGDILGGGYETQGLGRKPGGAFFRGPEKLLCLPDIIASSHAAKGRCERVGALVIRGGAGLDFVD